LAQSGHAIALPNVRVRASHEESPIMKAEWENLAKSYIRLAEQSEESDHIDVFYDPIIGILGGVAALNSKRHIPPQRTSATEKGEEAARLSSSGGPRL
jgi:hypothetical protein